MRKPVVIDCDTGTDDAIALLLAFQAKDFDIKAITSVAGNSTAENTALNSLKIAELAGVDVKVAKGSDQPIMGKFNIGSMVHGKSGLGNVTLPQPKKNLYHKNAYETIYEVAQESRSKIHIIATGPLTNIALTLLCYPDIKDKIEQIVIMGGACYGGNKSPVAEANIGNDPEAAHIVFSSGLPITMCGLDVTYKALIYDEDVEKIRKIDNKVASVAADLIEFHATFHKNNYDLKGDPAHDSCAVAYLIDPEIFSGQQYYVEIETSAGITRGETVVDLYNTKNETKNVKIIFDVDRERFVNLIIDSLSKY
jgi:pyrimidine-specific ribonucleoside hydrolase